MKSLMKVIQMNISTKPKRKWENRISSNVFVQQRDNNSITSLAYEYIFFAVYKVAIKVTVSQAFLPKRCPFQLPRRNHNVKF